VHPKIKAEFVTKLKFYVVKFFGATPKTNVNYSRLIHNVHTERCAKLLENNKDSVIHGDISTIDIKSNFVPPIIIDGPNITSNLMKEEIFGPILPLITYDSPEDIIKHIKANPRPLAVYYYGNTDSVVCERLAERTISGAFVVNDSVMHYMNNNLPFGGVGDSGYGTTHGRDGFIGMSHLKAYLVRPNSKFLDMDERYPSDESVEKRLKGFKKLGFALTVNFEDVACWFKSIFGVIALIALFIVLHKYEIM
jgi:aldehyde dehydrogenase (NAD+)